MGLRELVREMGQPATGHLLSRESWEVSAFIGVGSLQDRLKLRSRRSANAVVRAKPPLARGGKNRADSGPRLGAEERQTLTRMGPEVTYSGQRPMVSFKYSAAS